jgi:hypothetical protein
MKVTAARLGVALAAAWLAFTPALPAPADEPEPNYSVYVDPELRPSLRAGDVAQTAREAMERSGKLAAAPPSGADAAREPTAPATAPILSVDCVKGDEVGRVVGQSSLKRPGATLWVVRARGRFSKSVPNGGTIENDSGYYVIDDATGVIVAVGSPADRR